MTLGRFAYCSLSFTGKWEKRRVHGALMALAGVCALAGYFCVYKAHAPMRQFFGYDFEKQEWKPAIRLAHVYIGYLVVLLTVAQAAMGLAKVRSLAGGEDRKILTFHGSLGKGIIFFGVANVAIAAVFFPWSLLMKCVVVALCGLVLVFGVVLPRPAAAKEELPISGE